MSRDKYFGMNAKVIDFVNLQLNQLLNNAADEFKNQPTAAEIMICCMFLVIQIADQSEVKPENVFDIAKKIYDAEINSNLN